MVLRATATTSQKIGVGVLGKHLCLNKYRRYFLSHSTQRRVYLCLSCAGLDYFGAFSDFSWPQRKTSDSASLKVKSAVQLCPFVLLRQLLTLGQLQWVTSTNYCCQGWGYQWWSRLWGLPTALSLLSEFGYWLSCANCDWQECYSTGQLILSLCLYFQVNILPPIYLGRLYSSPQPFIRACST